jgi:hypothetical protein
MNKIKEFIKKKKADSKFKSAGKGHSLISEGSSASRSVI